MSNVRNFTDFTDGRNRREHAEHRTPWGKVWTSGSNVVATFKRVGWVPPTEYRDDYLFKVNREGGAEEHKSK